MKNMLALIGSGVLVAVVGVTAVSGQEREGHAGREGRAGAMATTRPAGGGGDLHHAMEGMEKAFKALKGQVADPTKNESSLELVSELERNTLLAKGMTPRGASTRPTGERAKYVADFRVDMANLLRTETELEEALIDGKNDKAVEALQTMTGMMQEGHKEFRPKRKRG